MKLQQLGKSRTEKEKEGSFGIQQFSDHAERRKAPLQVLMGPAQPGSLPVPFPVAEELNERAETEIRKEEAAPQHKQPLEKLKKK